MNGYLVIARFSIEDAPLRLLPGRKEALDYIATLDEFEARDAAQNILNVDIGSDLISFGLIEFTDGAPGTIEVIRAMEDLEGSSSRDATRAWISGKLRRLYE